MPLAAAPRRRTARRVVLALLAPGACAGPVSRPAPPAVAVTGMPPATDPVAVVAQALQARLDVMLAAAHAQAMARPAAPAD